MLRDTVFFQREVKADRLPDGATKGKAVIRLHYIKGNSEPYWSVTKEITGRRYGSSFGTLSKEVRRKYWPRQKWIDKYIDLHLSGVSGQPMNLVENGKYHAGLCKGMEKERNLEHLASHLRISDEEAQRLVDRLDDMVTDLELDFVPGTEEYDEANKLTRAKQHKAFEEYCLHHSIRYAQESREALIELSGNDHIELDFWKEEIQCKSTHTK